VQPDRGGGWRLNVTDQEGTQKTYVVNTLLNNLGAKPAALEGLVEGSDGYCPPGHQHPRIHVAGDLRASRYQRIVTAQGSGAEAVLAYYYDTTLFGAGGRR
jgi:thioredoxin reductase (NADPH)/alkyl hydroperoxide reductase subunit F